MLRTLQNSQGTAQDPGLKIHLPTPLLRVYHIPWGGSYGASDGNTIFHRSGRWILGNPGKIPGSLNRHKIRYNICGGLRKKSIWKFPTPRMRLIFRMLKRNLFQAWAKESSGGNDHISVQTHEWKVFQPNQWRIKILDFWRKSQKTYNRRIAIKLHGLMTQVAYEIAEPRRE